MGLFNFAKNAGKKIASVFGAGEANAAESQSNAATQQQPANDIKSEFDQYDFGIEGLDVQVQGSKVTLNGTAPDSATMERAILVAGNIQGVDQVESNINVANNENAAEPQFYEVKSGDTLSKIAKEVYGDANKYNVIFEANKPMLSHPDKIYPGQNLRIPQEEETKAVA